MKNFNKLLDIITKQNQFILEMFNDKNIPIEVKDMHSQKYNQLMIDMGEALQQVEGDQL